MSTMEIPLSSMFTLEGSIRRIAIYLSIYLSVYLLVFLFGCFFFLAVCCLRRYLDAQGLSDASYTMIHFFCSQVALAVCPPPRPPSASSFSSASSFHRSEHPVGLKRGGRRRESRVSKPALHIPSHHSLYLKTHGGLAGYKKEHSVRTVGRRDRWSDKAQFSLLEERKKRNASELSGEGAFIGFRGSLLSFASAIPFLNGLHDVLQYVVDRAAAATGREGSVGGARGGDQQTGGQSTLCFLLLLPLATVFPPSHLEEMEMVYVEMYSGWLGRRSCFLSQWVSFFCLLSLSFS